MAGKRTRKFRNLIYTTPELLVCIICLEMITCVSQFSIDHEPPKSRQRTHGKSKLYYAHKACNHRKGSLTLEEYKIWHALNLVRVGNFQKGG